MCNFRVSTGEIKISLPYWNPKPRKVLIMWEKDIQLLVWAFRQSRKEYKLVEEELIGRHGKMLYQQFKEIALGRLGY